jgi:hypothetical protein
MTTTTTHDHDHDHDDHAGHDHGEHDPHAWLSPTNAAAWLNLIAAELSAADPDNAGAYFANAAAARAEMEALSAEVNGILDPVRGGSFIVFHDAYQYFEADFDIPASGAISLSDATDPSPARIAEIQGRVSSEGIDCVLAEPQFNPGLVATVLDGTDANTGVIDPLGVDLEPGPTLYPQLIRIVEVVVDLLRQPLADTVHRLEVGEVGAAHRLGAAEMGQQRAFARGAHAGDVVERRGRDRLGAFLAVRADGEAVRLVAHALHEIEHRVVAAEREGARAGAVELLLALRRGRCPWPRR